MKQALLALAETPQNNLRICQVGLLRYKLLSFEELNFLIRKATSVESTSIFPDIYSTLSNKACLYIICQYHEVEATSYDRLNEC